MSTNSDEWVGKPYKQPRRRRPDSEYEIESLTKGLLVLEALVGVNFEPVSVLTIMERTGFNRDLVDRSLKTLRMKGYAVQTKQGWTLGTRLLKLSERYSDLCLRALASKGDT